MSQSTRPSANFDAIFRTAYKAYKKRTGQDITSHPLAAQLKTCDSPDAILAVLKAQVEEFDQSRRDDERLTKWLNPTVFSPAKVIFAGIGVLLLASKDVAASHDILVDIFERIENFFKRLEVYTDVRQTAAMTDVIIKIMVEVLSILAIATEEIKQGRAKIPQKASGKTRYRGRAAETGQIDTRRGTDGDCRSPEADTWC
ncbi:hypothetical protein EDB86DRAFT_244239 [Lactarius hatsudake]|nr:hypothetical protein EDB86DRAFT_244239 [Lactarius hatsudake]